MPNTLQTSYARLITEGLLLLQAGEVLSINSPESGLPFARFLARHVVRYTGQKVYIVMTSSGRHIETLTILPEGIPEAFLPAEAGHAMLTLFDASELTLETVSHRSAEAIDAGFLQKAGMLSDPPFFNRKISVPWSVIPYPTSDWASRLWGEEGDTDALWLMISSLCGLDSDDYISNLSSMFRLAFHRSKLLSGLGPLSLHIEGGGTSLHVRTAPDTHWEGGYQLLEGGRQFASGILEGRCTAALDKFSADGVVKVTKPFSLFGGIVSGAAFSFKEGKLSTWAADEGEDLLETFLELDPDAARAGSLSLVDSGSPSDTVRQAYGLPLLDRLRTTMLGLGGCPVDCVDGPAAIDEDKPEASYPNCNMSIARADCPIGTPLMNITATTEAGKKIIIMETGQFNDSLLNARKKK